MKEEIFLIDKKGCFEKGLLKEDQPSTDLAKKSVAQAEFFLNEALELFDLNKEQIGVISLYNAFFHTVRSLLFKDGVKERSHFCVARYLEEEYVRGRKVDVKFLNAFETMMSLRHNIQYSVEKVEITEDLAELSHVCEELIAKVKVLIK